MNEHPLIAAAAALYKGPYCQTTTEYWRTRPHYTDPRIAELSALIAEYQSNLETAPNDAMAQYWRVAIANTRNELAVSERHQQWVRSVQGA